MNIVTCRNEECSEYDHPKVMHLTFPDPYTDEPVTVDFVFCGTCGQRIEDIEEAPDA